MDVHTSSKTDDWATPQHVFDKLDAEFGFKLDVCADDDNAKADDYYTVVEDGLVQDWCGFGPVWMNSPYGRTIGKWIKKAYETAQRGHTVVCLLPSRTDTSWWHRYCAKSDDIRFVSGRIAFGDGTGRAPFPSVVVDFDGKCQRQRYLGSDEFTAEVEQSLAATDACLASLDGYLPA
ncbi:adenine methyltransferase [Rhizobium sp. CFBP 8752]|nr:adenine methyltransferase [Rhizobium sp. CFBP 8752]